VEVVVVERVRGMQRRDRRVCVCVCGWVGGWREGGPMSGHLYLLQAQVFKCPSLMKWNRSKE
jgi:hypothetical protein